MIIVSGTIVIDPEKVARGVELTSALVAETRQEPGNVAYEFFAALDDPSRFHIHEEWESQAAIDEHNQSAHLAAFYAAIPELGVRSVELYQYDVTNRTKIM
jgi:quinol monooxygenase YgiN